MRSQARSSSFLTPFHPQDKAGITEPPFGPEAGEGNCPAMTLSNQSSPRIWPEEGSVRGLRDELIQLYLLTDAGRMWKEWGKRQREGEDMWEKAGGRKGTNKALTTTWAKPNHPHPSL